MGQLRTMRAALELKVACKMPLDHPVMTTYAAQLLSRFQEGHDGHTPHERLRGNPFKAALLDLGDSLATSSSEKRAKRRAWEVGGALGKSNILGACTYDQRDLPLGRDEDGEGKGSASDDDC